MRQLFFGRSMSLRVVLLPLILVAAGHLAHGQNVTKAGTAAATFLKIGPGGRATAMGEAYVATANDLTSIYWNPAGLSWLPGRQAYFSHADWIADLRHNFAAVSFDLRRFGTVGLSFISLDAPDQEITTVEMPDGTGEFYSYQDIAVGVSYSRKLTDRFSVGMSAKYISQSIYRITASAIALDLGTLYAIPGTSLRLGMSLSNFGTKMQFTGDNLERQIDIDPSTTGETDRATAFLKTEHWDLPLNFKVAVAYDFYPTNDMRLTVGVDAVNPNDNRENLNFGAELGYREFIYLRGGFKGYNTDNHEGGLTYGGGLDLPIASGLRAIVDYSYRDFGRLNSVHRFGIGVKF